MRDSLGLIAESRGVERVAWVERAGRGITVGSSPIDVSQVLREQLFEPTRSVVLTSATLSADGKFDFIRRRLGMDFEIEEEQVSSPFAYPEQALLYLPEKMPDPRDQAYPEAALREVSRLVRLVGGGAFVLCTSYRMMHTLADALKGDLPFPALVQGDAPKQLLLKRFREAGDAVLFATSSFWEGVDVPGAALRLVILDKLPFGVPTDPLIAARCKRLEEEGERPFVRYLVPAAALALKQGFGRLIRTRSDRGIVALLDGRIRTKGYGKIFLRTLPPARRSHLFDEVERFWREGEMS
jgi:ATP-dependent DNA helicase DinG